MTPKLISVGRTVFDGEYFCTSERGGISSHGFRHHRAGPFGLWSVTEKAETTWNGKPATLMRNFPAVVDDFGTLVEVAA